MKEEAVANILKENSISNHSKRNSTFELLRIISMILIIAFHAGRSIDPTQLTITNRIVFYSFSSWGILGVDLFVILSAWFLSSQKFRFTKLLSLIFEICTYIFAFLIVSFCVTFYKTGNFTSSLFNVLEYHAKSFLSPFWSYEYWFVTAYIFMLLLSPFINKLFDVLDRKSLTVLLIVLSFIPIYAAFEGHGVIEDTVTFCYIYYTVSYLKKFKFSFTKKSQKLLPYLFIVFIIAYKVLESIYSDKLSHLSNPLLNEILSFLTIFLNKTIFNCNRHSISMLVIALMLFFSIKDAKPFHSKLINAVSACTLGVYLFHENIQFNLCNYAFKLGFDLNLLQNDFTFSIFYILIILGLFLTGTVVEFIRFQILQKPFNKLLNKKSEKYQQIDNQMNNL